MNDEEKQDAQWRQKLTPEQYAVCRCSATEPAFTGKFWNHHETGVYNCVACQHVLFASDSKYDSGSGWPSYFQPIEASALQVRTDDSHGMQQIGRASCRERVLMPV